MAHGYLGGDSEGSSPSMDSGIFSTEMMEKFLLSSIREGTRKCLSSSLPSPLGELVLDELWGGGGGIGQGEEGAFACYSKTQNSREPA